MGLFDTSKFLILDNYKGRYTVLFVGSEEDADINLEVFTKLNYGASKIKKINLKDFKKVNIDDIKRDNKLCESIFGKYFED